MKNERATNNSPCTIALMDVVGDSFRGLLQVPGIAEKCNKAGFFHVSTASESLSNATP